MRDPHECCPLGAVELFLDRPRRLRYDWRALAWAEAAAGKPLTALLSAPPDAVALLALWWAGLRGDDPALTPDAAAALLTPATLAPLTAAIGTALAAAAGPPACGAGRARAHSWTALRRLAYDLGLGDRFWTLTPWEFHEHAAALRRKEPPSPRAPTPAQVAAARKALRRAFGV